MQEISIKQEFIRKLFHLLILIFPISYFLLGRNNFLFIIFSITILVVFIDYFRYKNEFVKKYFEKIFGIMLREKEKINNKFCAASYSLVAASSIFLVFDEVIAATSFVILAICDAAASLVGRSIKSKEFFEKSVAGSTAFYLSGIIVILICGNIFSQNLWFYLFSFISLFFALIIEARPSIFDVDDNLSIPATYTITMTFFNMMWNFM